jgi:hypothetical protein
MRQEEHSYDRPRRQPQFCPALRHYAPKGFGYREIERRLPLQSCKKQRWFKYPK